MIFALPRIDFSKGIPPEFRTLTVVPTMLISPENIDHLIEALEVRFLANRDEHLHFGLLTDFLDAREETIPEGAGNGEMSVTVDGVERPDQAIPLIDDRQEHSVEVRIPAKNSLDNNQF